MNPLTPHLLAHHPHNLTWALLAGGIHLLICLPTALHVLLHKDDERAAIGWLGLILLSPLLGSILYWIFGINRVWRRARRARFPSRTPATPPIPFKIQSGPSEKNRTMMQAGINIHDAPYLAGNRITPLLNGDEAYPRMIASIESAQHDIVLSSYIFDCDRAGRQFVEALGAAAKRNVAVHVLLDGVLIARQWRKTRHALKRHGVASAHFFPFSPRFINLRNHRKILCVDGRAAFLGGLNIRESNLLNQSPRRPTQDIHFEITGPVIDQIAQAFADDWNFATGQSLTLSKWNGDTTGPVTGRILPDGPDENYQKLEWTLLAAINAAERNIRIVTPYFLPDRPVISALRSAVLRGVRVDLIIPEQNNLFYFDWAMRGRFPEFLDAGLNIHKSPKPFDHSKIFLIDGDWSFIGSANWDARSLSLNYEINLEAYDPALNAALTQIFETKKAAAAAVPKTEGAHDPLPTRIRNNFLRLLSPYL